MKGAAQVRVLGELMGMCKPVNGVTDAIVRVTREYRPAGPAENSLILVRRTSGVIAKYISWIGYHDIEIAHDRDDTWTVVEPSEPFDEHLAWAPFDASFPEAELPHDYF